VKDARSKPKTLADAARMIPYPKFWVWGELYYVRPSAAMQVLLRVVPLVPEISHVQGEYSEDDVWYSDPAGGGVGNGY